MMSGFHDKVSWFVGLVFVFNRLYTFCRLPSGNTNSNVFLSKCSSNVISVQVDIVEDNVLFWKAIPDEWYDDKMRNKQIRRAKITGTMRYNGMFLKLELKVILRGIIRETNTCTIMKYGTVCTWDSNTIRTLRVVHACLTRRTIRMIITNVTVIR